MLHTDAILADVTATIDTRLDQLAAQVDTWMRPYVEAAADGPLAPLYRMMAYHLGWVGPDGEPLARPARGKRVRPILAVLTCEALGGPTDAAHGPAVAVELIHNFSLVHDDIQDRGDQRHGRDTVWRLWGSEQGINVGDGLFALAQVALVDGLAASPRVAEAVRLLNTTCLRLVEGQFLDLHLESVTTVDRAAYEAMIVRKTAALIECSVALGALAAGAGREVVKACARFGRELGLAFQLQDDVLGVWGDPSVTGKPSGQDVRTKKKGLPLVLGLEVARGAERDELERRLSRPGDLTDDEVRRATALLAELGVRERADALVAERFDALERAVREALPPGREGDVLALCARLRVRQH